MSSEILYLLDPAQGLFTLEDYEVNLRDNLQDLLQRLHRGSYRPQPSLRKNIPIFMTLRLDFAHGDHASRHYRCSIRTSRHRK